MDLHAALADLSPLDAAALPDDASLPQFLDDTFSSAACIIDTLPVPPPPQLAPPSASTTRPRSVSAASALSGVSSTSNGSSGTASAPERLTIVPSAARPTVPAAATAYARDWKEVKPGGANPHDIKVYKLAAKDGGGAWFARRSVHEGIGFARFRRGLRREFEESLYRRRGVVREAAGGEEEGEEGMVIPLGVRGIGAERRLDRRVAKGVGTIDVFHLSAQFPGPSAPRDFVTACMSSSAASPARTEAAMSSLSSPSPRRTGREFTMVSRPVTHDGAPEQPGFVRAKYQSIEFIREIVPPVDDDGDAGPRRSLSVSDLAARASLLATVGDEGPNRPKGRPRSRTVGETPRKAVSFEEGKTAVRPVSRTFGPADNANMHRASNLRVAISADDLPDAEEDGNPAVVVSPADEAAGDEESVENEEGETYPVEWIMLTRSDAGGSVPRFMVERGTPGNIMRDAEKFLDWACEKVHREDELSDDEHEPEVPDEEPLQETEETHEEEKVDEAAADELRRAMSRSDSASNLSFMTASSGGEGEDEEEEEEEEISSGSLGSLDSSQMTGQLNATPTSSMLDVEPIANGNARARSDTAATSSSAAAAVQRLQTDAERAAARARTTREKDDRKAAVRLAKEEEKQRKLAEKHEREAARREEKFRREQEKAEEKRRKEEEKIRDRKRRLEERDEKVRQAREIEDLKREVEYLRRENDVLRREVATLTGVVAPPSRSSSLGATVAAAAAVGLGGQQRPASPASSSASSRGRMTKP